MENKKASFRKTERLCSIKAIDELFSTGKSFYVPLFKVIYSVSTTVSDQPPARILISIPKRRFKKAVVRNLLRRRIREAYRKNKATLYQTFEAKSKHIDFAIVWTNETPASYAQIEESVILMVEKLSRYS